MLQENLCKIGLSEKESCVYMNLLKMGPQLASMVAKRSGLKRTSTYSILNGLIQKGLVAKLKKNGTDWYEPNDPNCLVAFVDRKCKKFDYYRDQMLKSVPRFRELAGSFVTDKPSVKCFDGMEAIRNYLYTSLNECGENLYCILPKKDNSVVKNFLMNCVDVFKHNQSGRMKIVIPKNNDLSEIITKYFLTLKNVQYLYTEDLSFTDLMDVLICVFDDKVLMCDFSEGVESVIVIDGKEVVNAQKLIFESLFKLSND